jgi:nitrate/nitrite-specific signal transduction histidine kinase
VTSDRLRLEVEDHGVGMSDAGSGGLGLIAMRERADILQGSLEIHRPPDGGALVVLDIPQCGTGIPACVFFDPKDNTGTNAGATGGDA